MKIIDTFAIVKDSLYKVQYETKNLNEFAKFFKEELLYIAETKKN